MKAVVYGLGILFTIGLLFRATHNGEPELEEFVGKDAVSTNANNSDLTSFSFPSLLDSDHVPDGGGISPNDRNPSEWWHKPVYSTTRYDPTLASDPSYRELVTRHLFLNSFYKSPLRLSSPFQQTIETMEHWGIDPKHHLPLAIHAHNIAWEYFILHRNFRISNGNLVTERERKINEGRLAWNVENLKHRFDFLFGDYKEAQFEDLHNIEPEGMFIEPRLKIEPGTLLISE